MPVVDTDEEDGTGRVTQHLFGHAPEERAVHARATVSRDRDKVYAELSCPAQQGLAGTPVRAIKLDPQAPVLQRLSDGCQIA